MRFRLRVIILLIQSGSTMSVLSKNQILECQDLRAETVEVPQWGGSVSIRVMSGVDRDIFDAEMHASRKSGRDFMANFRARLVARCLVDEAGQRMFSETEIEQLGQKSGVALDVIFQAASKLNGLSKEAVEDLAKN